MIDILTIWTKWIDEKCEIDLRSASFLWSRVHDARDLIYNLSKNLLKVFVALRGKRGGVVSPSPPAPTLRPFEHSSDDVRLVRCPL